MNHILHKIADFITQGTLTRLREALDAERDKSWKLEMSLAGADVDRFYAERAHELNAKMAACPHCNPSGWGRWGNADRSQGVSP